MKVSFSLVCSFLLVTAVCEGQTAETPSKKPVNAIAEQGAALPANVMNKINAGDFTGLMSSIRADLLEKSGAKISTEQLKNPLYRHLLNIHEILRITGPNNFKIVFDKSKQDAEFVKTFLQDSAWLELYLGAGLIRENSPLGIQILSDIWKKDGQSSDFKRYQSLATGLASVFSAGPTYDRLKGSTNANPVRRYNIFKKLHQSGTMHPGFIRLRPWEMRFVVGHSWDDKSYIWANEHVNLPWRRYVGACWAAPYRGHNFFGDSVQGALYYVPWREGNTQAENTQSVGGVCGGLSYFGTMAANAHGIPAYPVGQPGHCAYAVRVRRGDWKGGFGGPDGGMHNHIFGNQAPTSYLLMEKVFADNEKADMGYLWAAQARLEEAGGNNDKAIYAWQEALKQTPLHPFFRKELQRLFKAKQGMTASDWYAYAKDALKNYKGNGFAAYEILKDVEPLFIDQLPSKEKIAWYKGLHEMIAGTPTSWAVKFQPVIEAQYAKLKNSKEQEDYLNAVLSTHLKTGDGTNFGQALEWAVKQFVEAGKTDEFSKAFARVAQAADAGAGKASGAPDPKKLQAAYGKAIYAAEMARSIPAFQSLSKAAAKYNTRDTSKSDLQRVSPDPDWKLLSPDGMMVRCSTTCKWDDPCEHLNMLKPCGGRQHSDKEKNPNVIVDLGKKVNVAGLIISKAHGNEPRIKKVHVSTSTDGATWFPLETNEHMNKEWKISVPNGKEARWIKVEAENPNPEFMHLRHILVYRK